MTHQKSLSRRFCPLSFLESVGYLFPYSFISFIFSCLPPALTRAHCHFEPLWKSVCMCAVPGSCWVCVLSLSLMSTHSSHCPYLKWPEPHQLIKSQAPPAHSAPSLGRVVYTLSDTHYNHTYVSYSGNKLHIKINLFSSRDKNSEAQSTVLSCHFCNLWWTAEQSFVLSQEIIFQDISRTASIKLFKGILSFEDLSSLWLMLSSVI